MTRAPRGSRALSVRASIYEAAGQGRRAVTWRAPTTSSNQGVLEALSVLRDRSRFACRNDGYAAGVIERMVTNVVGTGVKPLVQHPDSAYRAAVHGLWSRWVDAADANGTLSWYGMQQQAVRCWLEAGEVFVRRRDRFASDGLPVPVQFEVIEPELCAYAYNGRYGGNRIRAGIEFDPIGRRAAYWFYPSRPGDFNDFDPSTFVRVPAETVYHLYVPSRAGQLRGIPFLTRVLVRLRELDRYDDATLMRQQLSNMFVAFLKKSAVEDPALSPWTGKTPASTDAAGRQALQFQPGTFQELDPGEEVQFSDPPAAGGYVEFVRQQLRSVAAGTGVPYEVLTGDMSQVNDRTVRVILHEFRRAVEAAQHETVAFQLCRPAYAAWLDQAVLSGRLPVDAAAYALDPAPWTAVRWMPQGWPYINPVQDVQSVQAAILGGLTSRSAAVSAQGEDSECIDAEQAADNARADALGLHYASDGRGDVTSVRAT